MRYGTVINYFPAKGFGFIKADFGPDIFFHITALGACQQPPLVIAPGQPVKYELVPGTEPKKRRRPKRGEEAEAPPAEPIRPQAQLVELIDRIPGGVLQEPPEARRPAHPRAKRRKPTWRR